MKLSRFLPLVIVFILACLPVFYTWGRVPIWGDTIIPLDIGTLYKYFYQWIPLNGGEYFVLNYLPYFLLYKTVGLFTNNIYIISAVLLFTLKVVAGLGIYKLAKIVYPKARAILYCLPVIFYLLSAAQLSGSYYLYIYSLAPWFLYFVFKIIQRQKVIVSDLIWLTVVLFFSSINLPNPKYIFHLFFISAVIFVIAFIFKLLKWKFIKENLGKGLIFLLLSSYLIFPQLSFLLYYNPQSYNVHVRADYKDEGAFLDYGEAILSRMVKLHKDNISLNTSARDNYNLNPLVNGSSYIFLVTIIISVFIVAKNDRASWKKKYIFFLLTILYLFFAAGPNPPFGFIYEKIIGNFSFLAFLRTTAGATYFLSIFYAVLLFSTVLDVKSVKKQNAVLVFLLIAIFLAGYPVLNGDMYKNVKVTSPNTDTSQHGLIIPKEYLDLKKDLDNFKYDSKVLYPNSDLAYMTTNWGYFGVSIYDFLYGTSNIDCKNVVDLYTKNIGLVFDDTSLIGNQDCFPESRNNQLVKQDGFVRLYKFTSDLISPHFQAYSLSGTQPVLEYKKINPTKYRVRIHGASGVVKLVFNENFQPGWQIYLSKSQSNSSGIFGGEVGEPLTVNEGFQAKSDEIAKFIKAGWVTSQGNLFISKKFQGSIQNDNLPDNSIMETLFSSPIERNASHIKVNGYANGWSIDTTELCKVSKSCRLNSDGSNELEVIVEFGPQKIFYLGALISIIIMVGCISYLIL